MEALETGKRLLEFCQLNHSCFDSPRAFQPTPLLAIDSASRSLRVKVIEYPQESLIAPPRYVAPSYYRGKEQHLKLLRSNCESLQEGINIDRLSPLVQDAVIVVHHFGLQLCGSMCCASFKMMLTNG
jgi:hypothetical protein